MIHRTRYFWRACLFVAVASLLTIGFVQVETSAQQGPQPDETTANGESDSTDVESTPADTKQEGLNLLVLLTKGGWFMLPLGLLSILVTAISIERLLALRRSKVIPPALVTELGRLSLDEGGFDPREAYRIATKFPSASANVVRSMLLKVGRPQAEVEHAVAESSQREADRMHFNVRWLTLSAAVSPLVGLLGTVWGMIDAFYRTTQLVEGQDKAEQLADGIYTALITTLCGLVIAIPAAIFAQFCESRITSLFHEIDEMIFNLMPQVERFEGRVRFSRNMDGDSADVSTSPPPPPAAAATRDSGRSSREGGKPRTPARDST